MWSLFRERSGKTVIDRLFVRRPTAIGADIFLRLSARARQPVFYTLAGVPDSIEGRLELLMLHVALAVRRLWQTDRFGRAVSRRLIDSFFDDMEIVLREMSIGDKALALRLSRVAEQFYGRLDAYGEALSGGDAAALALAIRRNVFAGEGGEAAALAAYAVALDRALRDLAPADYAEAIDGFPPFALNVGASLTPSASPLPTSIEI